MLEIFMNWVKVLAQDPLPQDARKALTIFPTRVEEGSVWVGLEG